MNNIDWDDIDSCINCERQHDVSELTEINGDLMCESCIKNAKHSKAGL